MEGAYEIAEILISNPSIVERWLDEAENLPHTLMHTVAGWYTYSPRPSIEDIKSCHLGRKGPWTVLTLTIRRGKDVVAEFLSRHKVVRFLEGDPHLEIMCDSCKKGIIIPWDSIGNTGGELVKRSVSPCDASQGADTRSVQRSVDIGDSAGEQESRTGQVGTDSGG